MYVHGALALDGIITWFPNKLSILLYKLLCLIHVPSLEAIKGSLRVLRVLASFYFVTVLIASIALLTSDDQGDPTAVTIALVVTSGIATLCGLEAELRLLFSCTPSNKSQTAGTACCGSGCDGL